MKKGQLHPGVVAVILIIVLGVAAGVIYNMTNTPVSTGLEGGGFPPGGGGAPGGGGGKKEGDAKPGEGTKPSKDAKTEGAAKPQGKDDKTK